MWAMSSFIVNYVWVGRLAILFGQKRIEQYLCSVLKIFLLFLFLFLRDLQLRSCQNLNISFSTCVFFQFRNQKWSKRKTLLYVSFYEKAKPIYSLRLVENPLSIVKRNPLLSYDVIRELFLSFYQDIRPQKSFLITSRRQGILQTFLVTTDMRSSLFSWYPDRKCGVTLEYVLIATSSFLQFFLLLSMTRNRKNIGT